MHDDLSCMLQKNHKTSSRSITIAIFEDCTIIEKNGFCGYQCIRVVERRTKRKMNYCAK